MPKYKLAKPYWDGKNFFARGEVIEVSEGTKAPRGSIPIKEDEPELDLGPAKKPEPKAK